MVVEVLELITQFLPPILITLSDNVLLKPSPVRVTSVPPATEPIRGVILVTFSMYSKLLWGDEMEAAPFPVINTLIGTLPGFCDGVVHLISVSFTDTSLHTPSPSLTTASILVPNPEPAIVMASLPVTLPVLGLTDVTDDVSAASYTKVLVLAPLVSPIATATVVEPAACGGVLHLISDSVALVTSQLLPLIVTLRADLSVLKPVPWMVSSVPPAVLPFDGLTELRLISTVTSAAAL